MTFSLALDLAVAVLLVVTIVYAVALNRRLSALRKDKAELEIVASSFGEATMRAGESIIRLKTTADELQGQIDKAHSLRDDLLFLIERGGTAADRLEETVRAARKEGDIGPRLSSEAEDGAEPEEKTGTVEPEGAGEDGIDETSPTKSEAERELLKALQSAR